MKFLRLVFPLLLLFSVHALQAQESDYFSIVEHGPGRWMSFSTPISAQHNLTIKGLLNYSIVFNPDFEIRTSENSTTVLYLFRFEEIGEFDPALKPQLPANTNMQFIIDGAPSSEFKVQRTSFRNENDIRHVIKFAVVIPKPYVDKMVNARTVRGLLYYKNPNNPNSEKSDVKSFSFDAKTLRTLERLYSVAK